MGSQAVVRPLPESTSATLAARPLLLELAASVLFLAACAAAGFGITYLTGIALNLEERLVFGVVLGAAAVSATTFIPALLIREVTLLTVLSCLGATPAPGSVALPAGSTRAGSP